MHGRLAQATQAAAAAVVLALSSRAAESPALPANGSFEEVDAAGVPAGWVIGDRLGAVVADGAADGVRALRIVDGGTDVGSSVLSARFPVVGGGRVSLTLKLFLESGDAEGLGVYLRLWDAGGGDLAEARESQVARPPMQAGVWVDAAAQYAVPPEAVEAAVWLHTFSTAVVTCRVDALAAVVSATPLQASTGPLMDDAAFFAALDLDRPELAAVREAVAAGDLAAARAAYARHLRERTSPRWRIDWHQHPFRGVKVPPPDADNDPASWDYYSLFITVDWEGWKHFSLRKEDFAGRTFVEGKGWQGKNPIGWHWIKFLALHSRGWGLTPDPQTMLWFDDVCLIGPGKTVTIADFESPEPVFSGLRRDAAQARSGTWSGLWENLAQTTGVTCRNLPHDWTPFERLEFWAYSPRATGARVVMVLDSDPPTLSQRVRDLMAGRFTYSFAGGRDWTTQFDGAIDWHANPTEGPARTHLWNECLHRHFHFRDLANAYWETGDERPVETLVAHWMDWIRRNPPPATHNGNGRAMTDCSFQTLTTGIRLEEVWPDALYRCLGSPAFTDEVLVTIVKSVADQARHLMRWKTGGNWLTEESMGLYTAGMLFPEYREAAEWRRTAIERLSRQLDEDVYPDGMEVELAAGYSNWVVENFTQLLERADWNGLRNEIPADFLTRLERMYNYHLYAMMPNGAIPGLNDSGNADVRGFLMTASRLFPHREDFLFGATLGARGRRPAAVSYAFPYTGHYVMRSGWDAQAVYALFDAGPYGYGHQHEDKLHLVLYAYGRQLLLDPGNYSYDSSPWRRYVLSTAGHNTVLVDGLGQARGRRRETYVWPKPWDTPTPRGDDAFWAASEQVDTARGSYRDGYGPRGETSVAHTRQVVFLKPEYFVIVDLMAPGDDREHEYSALFHLDAEAAALDERTLAVRTEWAAQANLTVIPWRRGGLGAAVVKGQEDPVQGWANHPWRPVPTAVYTWKGSGPCEAAWVLWPTPAGEACPVRGVSAERSGTSLQVSVTMADGRTDRIVVPLPAGETAQAITVERLAQDGSVRVRWSPEASR